MIKDKEKTSNENGRKGRKTVKGEYITRQTQVKRNKKEEVIETIIKKQETDSKG